MSAEAAPLEKVKVKQQQIINMAKNLKEGRSAKASERGAILSKENAHSEYAQGQSQRRDNREEAGFSGAFGEQPGSPSTDVTAAGQGYGKSVALKSKTGKNYT